MAAVLRLTPRPVLVGVLPGVTATVATTLPPQPETAPPEPMPEGLEEQDAFEVARCRLTSPVAVEAEVARRQEELRLESERLRASVDRQVADAQIGALVNTWSARVVDIIWETGGVFDKMVGDCVIALFGPPFYDQPESERARRAIEHDGDGAREPLHEAVRRDEAESAGRICELGRVFEFDDGVKRNAQDLDPAASGCEDAAVGEHR